MKPMFTLSRFARYYELVRVRMDGNFMFSGGVISTGGFNTIMKKITNHGISKHLSFPQGHILCHRQGLSAAEYTRRNENRFIDGIAAQIDWRATIRNTN